jgi:hypothetical protein
MWWSSFRPWTASKTLRVRGVTLSAQVDVDRTETAYTASARREGFAWEAFWGSGKTEGEAIEMSLYRLGQALEKLVEAGGDLRSRNYLLLDASGLMVRLEGGPPLPPGFPPNSLCAVDMLTQERLLVLSVPEDSRNAVEELFYHALRAFPSSSQRETWRTAQRRLEQEFEQMRARAEIFTIEVPGQEPLEFEAELERYGLDHRPSSKGWTWTLLTLASMPMPPTEFEELAGTYEVIKLWRGDQLRELTQVSISFDEDAGQLSLTHGPVG